MAVSKLIRIFIRLIREGLHALVGIGPCCRFEPCCSLYCREAFTRHGFFKATYLSARRLVRCHPFGSAGWDPVPRSQPRFR